MKKVIFLLASMLLVVLTGCQSKEKSGTIICNLSTNDVISGYKLQSEYKIHYNGDYVDSVETTETITSDSEDVLENFETTLTGTYQKMDEAYDGYTYKISNKNGKVTSNVTIDYGIMDVEQLVKDQPSFRSYVKDNKILVQGLKSIYEGNGAVCK